METSKRGWKRKAGWSFFLEQVTVLNLVTSFTRKYSLPIRPILVTLRELIFAGINFHDFREFLAILGKLVPVKIIDDCAIREICEN